MNSVLSYATSLSYFLPRKKPRRSPRLICKEKLEKTCRKVQNEPLGYFDLLPLELKFTILTYLPVEELSVMTVTSKALRNLVELYKGTTLAQTHLLPRPITHQIIPISQEKFFCTTFHKLGVLMKRSTCLYTTRDRLKLMQQFLQRYLCNFHKTCDSPLQCIALKCYGKFLHTVIAGWDDKELVKVFDTVAGNTLMLKHLSNIISAKSGTYSNLELHVRLFFRRVFIDHAKNDEEKAFWLDLILKSLPMVHQAKVLFLLFGPVATDSIQWHEVCESAPISRHQAETCFSDLAEAFVTLQLHSKYWTEDDIVSVIDELTGAPNEWLADNVAHLLYLCGEEITLPVLNSKAINGRVSELANLITSLCTVCLHQGETMSWVVRILISVLSVMENSRDKFNLLHAISEIFKEIITDLHDYADAVDEGSAELDTVLEAQSLFYNEVMTMAFQQYLPVLHPVREP